MPSYAPSNINSVPNGVLASIPSAVIKSPPNRFVPSLRAGYFYIEDRRYILPSKKGSGYLEDITWYDWQTADNVISGSERVWVRGIEVTGTGHYRFRGGNLQINGGSLTHPGVLIEEINYDVSFLDPIDLGGILDPDAQIRIEYDFYDWVNPVAASASIIDTGTIAGILIEVAETGVGGNDYVITINASGGAGTGATFTKTGPGAYDLDWFNSTTVQEVIDAIEADALFTATDDGVGTPGTDTFTALLASAGITPPDTLPFAGGVNAGFTISTQTEYFRLGDATPLFELPEQPANNLPVIMTDDRMQRWDRRNISPQFTVSEEGVIEFNSPRNYISNPDFDADLELWMTAGSPSVETEDATYTLSHSYSNSQYILLPTASDKIGQHVVAFDEDEHLLTVVARGVTSQVLKVSIQFFDINWTSLATETDTYTMTGDWQKFSTSFGPAGRLRTYDFAPQDDAAYALITLEPDTGNTNIHIDYVAWNQGKLVPDAWHPHARITVEYDLGDTETYEHDTLITHHLTGDPLANIIPLEVCNAHGVTVSKESGFLYFYESEETSDFQLGLGGLNAPIGEFDYPLTSWPTANGNINGIAPIPGGGFYIVGAFSTVGSHTTSRVAKIKADGTVDTDFTVSSIPATVYFCEYDSVDDILYIGGGFTTVNGSTRNRAAALDGTDATLLAFDPNCNNDVNAIVVDRLDAGGVKVYMGGLFTDVNSGTTRNYLAKFDTDGVVEAWDPDLNQAVLTLVLGDDRWLYAGGSFTTVGGGATSLNRVARWDVDAAAVTVDTTFDPDVTGGDVYMLRLHRGILYLGGAFTSISSTTRNRIGAVDQLDGTLISYFDPNANNTVYGVWPANEEVFIAGDFTTIGGVARSNAAMVGTDGTLSDWDPNLAAGGALDIFGNEGVICLGGVFTTVGGDSFSKVAFFKYFDNQPVKGRRWLPYAKTDGLGKLSHVAHLNFYADPWTKEVTEVSDVPVATTLELLPVYGMTRGAITYTVTAAAGNPAPPFVVGDTEITGVTGAYGLVQPGDYAYLKDKLHETQNAFQISAVSNIDTITLRRPLPVDLPDTTVLYVEYRQLRAFVGQQRVIRLKLTDQFGAPFGQHYLTVANEDPDIVQIDWDLPTNQDGETSYLLTFLAAGSAKIRFSGSSSVTLNVLVSDLPSASNILDDPVGPDSCSADYSTSISDWT